MENALAQTIKGSQDEMEVIGADGAQSSSRCTETYGAGAVPGGEVGGFNKDLVERLADAARTRQGRAGGRAAQALFPAGGPLPCTLPS